MQREDDLIHVLHPESARFTLEGEKWAADRHRDEIVKRLGNTPEAAWLGPLTEIEIVAQNAYFLRTGDWPADPRAFALRWLSDRGWQRPASLGGPIDLDYASKPRPAKPRARSRFFPPPNDPRGPMTINISPLRCTVQEVITTLFRALALRHGCTVQETETIRAPPCGYNGPVPCLASVKAGDGREVYRVEDLADLDRLLADPLSASFMARAVHRSCEASTT